MYDVSGFVSVRSAMVSQWLCLPPRGVFFIIIQVTMKHDQFNAM
jgi:hypothetical protein